MSGGALIQRLLMCKLSRGDERRRDQRGRPQEEKADFLMERGALKAEETWSEVAFEEVRKHAGLSHEGALMQCQGCRQTTAENTRQMIKMSPMHPLTLFVLFGKDEQDLRRDPDTCFIQVPTGHSSNHSPIAGVLQSNQSFLRISELGHNHPRVVRTEPMKGTSCCRC